VYILAGWGGDWVGWIGVGGQDGDWKVDLALGDYVRNDAARHTLMIILLLG